MTVYGRHCRTVLCVGASPRRDDDEVGLLDCRPILEGWSKVYTVDRWLDVGALRHSLSQAAPEGYLVDLSGCCRHWNWLWLNPGQVVVVSYTAEAEQETVDPAACAPPSSETEEDHGPSSPRLINDNGAGQGPTSYGTSTLGAGASHDDAETSSVVSCYAHTSPEAVRYLLIFWATWLLECIYIPSILWLVLVPAGILLYATLHEHASMRFQFCYADRALMIWLCFSVLVQHGPLAAAAVQHKPVIWDQADLLPLPGARGGLAVGDHFGARPLPTPCRNYPPRCNISCRGEPTMLEHQQLSPGPNIMPGNIWCLSATDSHPSGGISVEELGPLQ